MTATSGLLEAWRARFSRPCAAVLAFVLGIAAAAWSHGHLARGSQGMNLAQVDQSFPRFQSLKADRVALRNGPGPDYPISWVFMRPGLPVEVLQEVDGWRHVRDADGTAGWVSASFLSAQRTAILLPWSHRPSAKVQQVALLRDDGNPKAGIVALVEAGVLLKVAACDGAWCRVSVDGVRGHIERAMLWGVYKGEAIKP